MGDIERAPTDRDEARAEPQVVVRVARRIADVAAGRLECLRRWRHGVPADVNSPA